MPAGFGVMRLASKTLVATVGVTLAVAVLPGAALATSSPVIESESAAHIASTDATLAAQINTDNLFTAYEFEIDTNASYNYTKADCPLPVPGYAQCDSIAVGEPLPAGLVEPWPEFIAPGSGTESVSLDLASIGATLQPATTYHYRVIASNGGPIAEGPDQTFTTLPPGAPPVIESVSLSHLTGTDATLEAKIDTEGMAANYQFYMWSSCAHEACEDMRPIPLPPGRLLGSFVGQSVSLDLNSVGVTLRSGEEYGWGVTATDEAGEHASANSGVFEPLEGSFEPLPSKSPPAAGGGQPPASGNSDQPAGAGTSSSPVLQTSSPLGGLVKTGTAKTSTGKPKPDHGKHLKGKRHGKAAKRQTKKTKKHKR